MKKHLAIRGLYVIIDPTMCKTNSILDITEAILSGGANIIQYRDKNSPLKEQIEIAKNIKKLCQKYKSLFIINDFPEIAIKSNSDGVHIGQDDTSIYEAKTILNSNQIIGTSNNNLNEVSESSKENADYIAVGALYATKTMGKDIRKTVGPNLIKQSKNITDKPIVGIGGINKSNIHEVIDAGADAICIVSEIISNSNPELITREFADIIQSKLK
ncbi:MAG: thiamine phosphate synthase [Chloroflexi bacterium]|nr:thiamine phosphate synthase [Chloroflexota bacterium]|tara:strand:+ start:1957 stop:2601 length:645 start_codon:yes stop_codon:yes gene_type:complete